MKEAINTEYLIRARLNAGFKSQGEAAKACSIARGTVNAAENGNSKRVGKPALRKMADMYGVSIDALLMPDDRLSPQEQVLLAAYRQLDEYQKARVLVFAQESVSTVGNQAD